MSITRRDVLRTLAARSDAETGRTTTVETLAVELGVAKPPVTDHLDRLRACELAVRQPNGDVRVTRTGEELLALDTDGPVIVDPNTDDAEP